VTWSPSKQQAASQEMGRQKNVCVTERERVRVSEEEKDEMSVFGDVFYKALLTLGYRNIR
jgi:hypothetical protein